MHFHVIWAVFRRNFVSYFSNPTGYVFICVFVLLSAVAAFWPDEFFNANLANLDQLNAWLPYIMLVFIPAITMSIWADERRQGTDEFLLTLPATDFDVVLGKYFAALSIFTVSLLFSLSNLFVLAWLGNPDWGLLLGNYAGYWLVGAAMLAIGMVASFLTGNLTVGFVLGVLLNAPLVFAGSADGIFSAGNAVLRGMFTPWFADTVFSPDLATQVRGWGLADQFRDFGRGVATLSGIGYFLAIIAVMLYLSMVLIGRRHWSGGRDGTSLGWHYFVRALALVGVAAAVTIFLTGRDFRIDVTAERLSSLSPRTKELLAKLDPKRPVQMDAYVSTNVPEAYVQTRLNLLAMLRELETRGRDRLQVRIHDTEPNSRAAALAEEQFGIKPQHLISRTRGALKEGDIYLGVASTCGLEKVVIPFIDRGMPVEYELIRSIGTAAAEKRKKVGVLQTDAKLYGSFDMQRMMPSQNELIIEELQKQYEVVQVDATNPITQQFDVLLAVQPSSLGPQQLDNFVAGVRSGIPTAIFEDPFPYLDPSVPGTSAPKKPPQANPFGMGGGPPEPKGDVLKLWDLLGVQFRDREVIWQDYNPYPKITQFPQEFVFIDAGQEHPTAFNLDDSASARLQQMLFLFPGAFDKQNAADLKFVELVVADRSAGTVKFDEIMESSMFGGGNLNPVRRRILTNKPYTLAARISGKPKPENLLMSDEGSPDAAASTSGTTSAATPMADKPASDKPTPPTPAELNVVLVSDIDVLYSAFFALRARGDDPESEETLELDNVSFVLNVLDSLAKDDRFIDIRKKRRAHRVLEAVESRTAVARGNTAKAREQFLEEYEKAHNDERKKLDDMVEQIRKQDGDPIEKMQQLAMAQQTGQKRLDSRAEELKKDRDRKVAGEERKLALEVSRVQDTYKMMAVALPPIPPLVIGAVVFFLRRSGEREGVSSGRLRRRR